QREKGRVGHPCAAHSVRVERKRKGHPEGYVDPGGGNAGGGRGAEYRAVCGGQRAWPDNPRNGHGEDGPGSEDLGAQRVQPNARYSQSISHRWRGHGVLLVRKSLAHLYGAHGASLRLRRATDET